MKKILVQGPGPKFANNAFFLRDTNDMSQHWRELRDRLGKLGYELSTADDNSLEDCERIIFLDSSSVDGIKYTPKNLKSWIKKFLEPKPKTPWPARNLYQEAMKNNMGDKLSLFLFEGNVVSPNNYDKKLWEKFETIFTWDDDLVDGKKFFKFFIPTPVRPVLTKVPSFHEKKLLVNISANRYYPVHNELYSARRKTSAYFSSHYSEDFDLFGARWHMAITRAQQLFPFLIPRFACWRGVTPDKIKTMSLYKFSLCYENISKVRGYISEKIFDTIQAGSVPIYWGADNIGQYVDPAVFVDRRKFKSDEDLARYLKSITEEEYNKMILAGQKYLDSDQFRQFTPGNFCDRVIEVLAIKPLTITQQ